jgi:TPR repeat protein
MRKRLRLFFLQIAAAFILIPSSLLADPIPNIMEDHPYPVSFDEVYRLFQKQCDMGRPAFCQTLALAMEKRRDAKKNAEIINLLHLNSEKILDHDCKGGIINACFELISIYSMPYGRSRDLTRIPNVFKLARSFALIQCQERNVRACLQLTHNLSGIGTPEYNIDKSKEFGRLAVQFANDECDNNVGEGCRILAGLHPNGSGESFDIEVATRLYRKACDLGSKAACIEGGLMFNSSRSIKRDKRKAAEFYNHGCELGSSISCSNLLLLDILPSGNRPTKQQKAELSERMFATAKINCENGVLPDCGLWHGRQWYVFRSE